MNQPDPTRTDGAAQPSPTSDCCHARVHIAGGKEGTQWAVCDKCGEPCNVVDPSASAPVHVTVEQKHAELLNRLRTARASWGGIDWLLNENEAKQLLADFEARAVAEATAEIRKDVANLYSALSKCHTHFGKEIQRLTLNESAANGTQVILRCISEVLDACQSLAQPKEPSHE